MRIGTAWAAAIAVVLAVPAGCGDGASIIEGHDYSAFYDFGGGGDVAAPDTTDTDAFDRDVQVEDDFAQVDQGGAGDNGGPDANEPPDATPDDTTPDDPGVQFVSSRMWETRANAMIGAAKKSVDIVNLEFLMYSPDDISVATSVKNAAARGVKVRVLLDDQVDGASDRVADLNAVSNITAKLDNWNGTTHVKLIVVDGAQVLVGSTNLSKAALHFNNEANLWITDPDAVGEYVDYYAAVWNKPGSTVGMKASKTASGILPIGDDEYVAAVSPYVSGASSNIRIVMYDINQESYAAQQLTDLLIGAAGRNVPVRVYLERSADDYAAYVTEDNEYSAGVLERGGVEVRFDQAEDFSGNYETVTHAKLVIVDDAVVVYSGNWTNNGLEENHEAGAVVDGVKTVTDAATTWFNTLWTTGVAWP